MKGTRRKIKTKVDRVPYHERENKPSTLSTFKTITDKFYTYYKKRLKKNREEPIGKKECKAATREVYKAIRELYFEKEGGVFLPEIGYFTAVVIPWNDFGINIKNKTVNQYFQTEGYNYAMQLYTDLSTKSVMKGMIMDRTFSQPFKSEFHKNMLDGFKPKLYYTSLKELYGYKTYK